MGVGVHGQRDLAMPKDVHDDAGRDFLSQEQGSACVAKIVEPHRRQLGLEQQLAEEFSEDRIIQRTAIGADEHRAGLLPFVLGFDPFGILLLAMYFQGSDGKGGKDDGSCTTLGLGCGQLQFFVDALQLVGESQGSSVEVDVVPSKSCCFTNSQTDGKDDGIESL